MKAERRKKIVSIADVQPDGPESWFRKYGNSLLTGLLIAMAVVLLVRWRMNTAATAKLGIQSELAAARTLVDQLHSPDSMGGPADLIKNVQTIEVDASGKLSDIMNTSDDAIMRAQALVIQGDLYWQMANLPAMPGATTEPTLSLKRKPDELLKQAEGAYLSVLNGSEYAGAHDAINAARLGLAAISENRGDWVNATKQLNAIKNDPNALGEKVMAANIQLSMMTNPVNSIQDPTYLAPASGTPQTALPTTLPTTQAALAPIGPMGPSTLPTFTMPTTLPSVPPSAPLTLPTSLLPTTRPK